MAFLDTFESRPLELRGNDALKPLKLVLGRGMLALEVAVVEAPECPSAGELRDIWRRRLAGRAVPLLLVVLYKNKAALCGPAGDVPQVFTELNPRHAERMCEAALAEPDRHASLRFLRTMIPDVESPIMGIRNEGFLATQELQAGVRQRNDWSEASSRGLSTYDKRGRELIKALGFEIQPGPGPLCLLVSGASKVAIAAFLDRDETPELASERFSGVSPVSYALARADVESLPYLVMTSGSTIRIYPVKIGVGVGRRGRTETYVEAHLGLLPRDMAAYLWYLFSSEALRPDGYLYDIINRSADYVADLGKSLQKRVYDEVVPKLAEAIAQARRMNSPTADELDQTLQMALTVLFRLLFIAYAEDKELLPYRTNELYRTRSLKQKAREILSLIQKERGFGTSATYWNEVFQLFAAVRDGQAEWGVPAYDGSLFSDDPSISTIGAALKDTVLDNQAFVPVLRHLLLDESPEGLGPVDFRSLGVREFGTIYEGLLESQLEIAQADLTRFGKGSYRPAEKGDPHNVKRGKFYLSNSSGVRKSTGSYFTKPFAVEHLLDHALEPALDAHLAHLDKMSSEEAGNAFFDFRVADIAMGSGHFLVASVDRIERKLSEYLVKRPLPTVSDEIDRLRKSAQHALGPLAEGTELEDSQLLRRQIARRCIYGVDLNPMAVELARVSLWIHTFVPGLPLSLLDLHLVKGDSLVGIGTLVEAKKVMGADSSTVFAFDENFEAFVKELAKSMGRIGQLSDATTGEVLSARSEWQRAVEAAKPYQNLMDVLGACRSDSELADYVYGIDDPSRLTTARAHDRALKAIGNYSQFHFMFAFPEVFWRDRSGFDVILGNPPWEEETVEEDKFWTRVSPGLAALKQHEQEQMKEALRKQRPDLVRRYQKNVQRAAVMRRVLTSGQFPSMGVGDPDLYKAFCWRFWNLLAEAGYMGVVLPRSAFMSKGSQEFRLSVYREGLASDLTFLLNNRQWVFEEVHPQYSIALVCIQKKKPDEGAVIPIRGPFRSFERFKVGVGSEPTRFLVSEVLTWTDSGALPLLPDEESSNVFLQIRKAPRLDLRKSTQWRTLPHRELDATNDKGIMHFSKSCPKDFWPVYGGKSFEIWNPDTGNYYAWIDPRKLMEHLQQKRTTSSRNERSPFSEFSEQWIKNPKTLPCLRARVAFRDVARATDTRTAIAALLPPKVAVNNTGPYLLWPQGDERNQAFLLGVLCSIPLDWYARRFVETHMNFHIFNALPVPRPRQTSSLYKRAVTIAGRLACPDNRFSSWAKSVGVETGPLKPEEKQDMIAELDAVVSHMYGLSERQLCHIFETFHEGWDSKDRLDATLTHYHSWEAKA